VREALSRPQSFNSERGTVEAVIASSTPVQRQDGRGSFNEVLDPGGLDVAASRGASVLDSHNQAGGVNAILGTLEDVRVEGNMVIGTIRFSGRPEIAPIVDDVRSGIISHLSVGYSVEQWRDGTDGNGNRTRTATKWVIREASFVSVPADRNARTRSVTGVFPSENRADINRQIRALASRAGVSADIVNDLIDRNVSVAEAREQIVFEMQVRSAATISTAHNMQTMDNPEVRVRVISEALYNRVNPRFVPSSAARPFVGLTFPELARECLNRAGVNVFGASSVSLVERALHTTTDFPLILGDTLNKTLRASYDAAASPMRQLARQTTAPDFRAKHRLMLDSSGMTLDLVPEAGEYQQGTWTEAEETFAVATFGKIFAISRQIIVNDDIGAFADIPTRMGRVAAAFEAQQLVDLLTSGSGLGPTMKDGQRLFHSTHGNVSGSGAAPSDTTLTAALLAMRRQTGPAGSLIQVEPRFLLMPPDIEIATKKVLTAIAPVTVDDVNPWSFLTPLVEPRLTDTKRWYLVADPAVIDSLEYAYLAGAEGPQVETRAGFEVDGVQTKVRLDFGCGFVDTRGWYSNAGV
jgi:phage head maturation protease